MGQSCTGHQGLRAKRRDLRKEKTEVLALGIQGYMAPESREPETKQVHSAPVSSYLKTVFSLAKGEGLQGTGKRRWAARRRCQQQS